MVNPNARPSFSIDYKDGWDWDVEDKIFTVIPSLDSSAGSRSPDMPAGTRQEFSEVILEMAGHSTARSLDETHGPAPRKQRKLLPVQRSSRPSVVNHFIILLPSGRRLVHKVIDFQ